MVNAQDSKTYRPKNLKFVLNLFLLLFISVAILLYLFSINTFVPYSADKQFNWINIFTFSSLVFSIIFSISTLFIYSLLTVLFKKGWGIFKNILYKMEPTVFNRFNVSTNIKLLTHFGYLLGIRYFNSCYNTLFYYMITVYAKEC